ncbi:MAG: ABC transporter ATP-binding protein [Planctomycetaceae bacterium]|nr:ABC transporter ATP-binding protein [Planctomycetaceae bacterium]
MSQPIIEVRDLSRKFKHTQALDSISLDIPAGGVFGLVGENGAGKTTLIKHILGLLKPQSGAINVFGIDPVKKPEDVLARIGYLSEERDLPDWLTIRELMDYSSAFYSGWDHELTNSLIDSFQLEPNQKIRSLSRGQRARVGLINAAAHRPELLLLDEPSSGLDPSVRRDILGEIIRSVADAGRTVLFSSHLLDEVQRVSDRIAMIHQGKLILFDEVEAILSSHHRVVLRFESQREAAPEFPGVLHWSGSGQEWAALCNGQLETLKSAASAGGAEIVEQSAATLDDVFVAYTSGSSK